MRLREATARRCAWLLFALCAIFYVIGLVVPVVARDLAGLSLTRGLGLAELALWLIGFCFPLAGLLIALRQPANRMGWLMLATGLVLGVPADPYAVVGLGTHPGSLPGATVVAAFASASWAPALGLVATFMILLFPDGHLPSPRWRWVGWFSALSMAWVYLLITFTPGEVVVAGVAPFDNPLGLAWLGDADSLLLPTIVVLPVSFVLCAAALVHRFRNAQGVERLQLKWLATAGTLVAGVYLLAMLLSLANGISSQGEEPTWLLVLQELGVLSFGLIPLAIAVAILKHGLYEIDVVINKALVLGALASFITAVYVGIVAVVGSLVDSGGEPNLALSIAATSVVAVAFHPVRERVQRLANRLVYGDRATPYEVLTELAARVGRTYAAAELLPVIARAVAEGVAARRVEVWLRVGDELTRETAWPRTAHEETRSRAASPEDLAGDRVVPVRHQGELLGALTITKPAGEPLSRAEEKLLDDVAGQAGLVLRNIRLIEELRASRQRLVNTQDEERRRLERNLHDGAQQSLVSVALMVRTLRAHVASEPEVEARLDQAAQQLSLAIEELRELARGIHPAVLSDRGLGPAISSLAERSPVPVEVVCLLPHRPPHDVERTAYFVLVEALSNVLEHARATGVTVRVAHEPGALVLDVVDDGVGGADPERGTGLRGLADRVAVVDGTLEVTSPVGGGTRLGCRIPVVWEPPAPPTGSPQSHPALRAPVGAQP